MIFWSKEETEMTVANRQGRHGKKLISFLVLTCYFGAVFKRGLIPYY
jgi:hypothetical protein